MTHHKYTAEQVQGIKDAGNTWKCARSGEWDLLESTMFGNITNNEDYRKLYANNISNKGSKGKASFAGMGSSIYSPNQDWGSTHYFQPVTHVTPGPSLRTLQTLRTLRWEYLLITEIRLMMSRHVACTAPCCSGVFRNIVYDVFQVWQS